MGIIVKRREYTRETNLWREFEHHEWFRGSYYRTTVAVLVCRAISSRAAMLFLLYRAQRSKHENYPSSSLAFYSASKISESSHGGGKKVEDDMVLKKRLHRGETRSVFL